MLNRTGESEINLIMGNLSMPYGMARDLSTHILNEVLDNVIKDLEEYAAGRVPDRSGDLKNDILKWIRSSRVRDDMLKIIIHSDLDYAQYVDKMSSFQVKHYATWLEHSGKKAYSKGVRVFLDDPDAIGNIFYRLKQYAAQRLDLWMTRSREKYSRIIPYEAYS